MHQSLARHSAPVLFVHALSLADFITTIVGFDVFGTHTIARRGFYLPSGLALTEGEIARSARALKEILA